METKLAAGPWQFTRETRYAYDGWNLLAEWTRPAAAAPWQLVRTHHWGPDVSGTRQGAGGVGGLLLTRHHAADGTVQASFPAYDGNGNILALLSLADGQKLAEYEYGPFGEPLRATGPMAGANPFRWSTKYTDSETGLVYYGYRFYDASRGRWLSRDPIAEWGARTFMPLFSTKR